MLVVVPHVPASALLPTESQPQRQQQGLQMEAGALERALATAAFAREWRTAEDLRQIEEKGGRDTAGLLEYLQHMHADLRAAIMAGATTSGCSNSPRRCAGGGEEEAAACARAPSGSG